MIAVKHSFTVAGETVTQASTFRSLQEAVAGLYDLTATQITLSGLPARSMDRVLSNLQTVFRKIETVTELAQAVAKFEDYYGESVVRVYSR